MTYVWKVGLCAADFSKAWEMWDCQYEVVCNSGGLWYHSAFKICPNFLYEKADLALLCFIT